MSLKDDVTAAIRRAFQLGQTYWQQADSESYKENKKADATRDRYNALCIETAEIAARADTRIAELETAMKRQAAAVRMLDMSHVARAETMMQHAQVLHDLSKPDELESLRQANAILTADVERAEAELARLRGQEPVGYVTPTIYRMLTSDDPIDRSAAGRYAILFASNGRADTATCALYAEPMPAKESK